MMMNKKHEQGFTLVELLLVLVVISMIIYAAVGYMQQRNNQIRIDKTSQQMQLVLNAGLAYYVAKGRWPGDITQLQDGYYLPNKTVAPGTNPWGQIIYAEPTTPPAGVPSSFQVWTLIPGNSGTAIAKSIAGTLPFGFTGKDSADAPPTGNCASNSPCVVAAMVTIPGQNLNNAMAVNFAGLYHHGGCVPVPQCPVDVNKSPMRPEIIVVPVSVSGVNDPTTVGSTANVYPLTSFTAYATSNNGTSPPTNTRPPTCNGVANGPDCSNSIMGNPATAYWRVCLQVQTDRGDVATTNTATGADAWGRLVTLMGMTRCAISNEPAGSKFDVYSN